MLTFIVLSDWYIRPKAIDTTHHTDTKLTDRAFSQSPDLTALVLNTRFFMWHDILASFT